MSTSFKKKPLKTGYYRPKPVKTFSNRNIKKNRVFKKIKRSPKKSIKQKILAFIFHKKTIATVFIIILILGIASLIFIALISKNLPNPSQLIERDIAQSTTIYDRTGENILYEFHGEEKRTLINLEEIPDHVKQSTIAIEDKNFYKHKGFSVWAMIRTIGTNILYNRKAGAQL